MATLDLRTRIVVTFGKNSVWRSGEGGRVVDVEVSLGSGDKSSTCRVVLADPGHELAAQLINHSLASGGIQDLPEAATNKAEVPTIPGIKAGSTPAVASGSSVGIVATGAEFTPEVKAFGDTVVMRETPEAVSNPARSYYRNNQIGLGFFNEADVLAGGGFPASARRSQNVGRYQINRGDWEDAKKANPAIKGFSPLDQDLVFLYKINNVNRGGKELRAGDYKAALRKAANEWVSIPGGPQYQGQAGEGPKEAVLQRYYNYYEERLAYYRKQSGASGTNPVSTAVPVKPDASLASEQPVVKGSQLTVEIDGISYFFVHQSTELSEAGQTILTGQGVRWQMSRRKRSATYKDIELKTLAEQVARDYKIKVDYQSTYNPKLVHVDQSGISDYQLLVREATASGLMVAESRSEVVIKDRAGLKASGLVLSRGTNLISYKIADKALGKGDDEISKALPQSGKLEIDPITGKVATLAANVSGTPKPTGSASPSLVATAADATKRIAETARTKRIGGLPSVFVLPLDISTLILEPLATVNTKGFPGVLDRIWVIKKVTHKVLDNTSTIEVVSPVEVADASPTPEIPGIKPEGNANTRGWIYPCTGTVTSLYGPRNLADPGASRNHSGTDIGNGFGTPIYAIQGGVCSFVGDRRVGGGLQVQIKHDGAYSAYESIYLHNQSITINPGDKVTQGQLIATMGNSNWTPQYGQRAMGPHAHLTIKLNGAKVSPASILPKLASKGSRITAKEPS